MAGITILPPQPQTGFGPVLAALIQGGLQGYEEHQNNQKLNTAVEKFANAPDTLSKYKAFLSLPKDARDSLLSLEKNQAEYGAIQDYENAINLNDEQDFDYDSFQKNPLGNFLQNINSQASPFASQKFAENPYGNIASSYTPEEYLPLDIKENPVEKRREQISEQEKDLPINKESIIEEKKPYYIVTGKQYF